MARVFAPVRRQSFARLDDSQSVWLYGLHAVRAALANDRRRLRQLLMTAEQARAWTKESAISPRIVARGEIDALLPAGAVHQGIALLTDPLPALALEDFIAGSPERALTLALDQITDPHNVGAILRSAAAFGADAVIVQERHCPPLSGTVAKVACGALERVPVIAVTNLARGLRRLQQGGFWCIGLTGAVDTPLERALGAGRTALVLGAEGDGLRHLTEQTCDELARLPTQEDFSSLNVSNAAAVALYIAHSRRIASP